MLNVQYIPIPDRQVSRLCDMTLEAGKMINSRSTVSNDQIRFGSGPEESGDDSEASGTHQGWS